MEPAAVKSGYTVIPTPKWVLVLRIFQIIMSVITVAMAGWWIHSLYRDALGFVIVCGLFTWITAFYTILSERAAACRQWYNTWAVLALEGTMILFWLAAMGATANTRAAFRYNVQATCTSDGSAINSGRCYVSKRNVGVASREALEVLSGIAACCAFVMLLFIPSFAYVCHFFRLACRDPAAAPHDAEKQQTPATEMQPQAPLPPPPPQQQQQYPQQYHQQQQYPQQQQQQQQYPQPQQQQYPQPPIPVASQWPQAVGPQTNGPAYHPPGVGSPGNYPTAQNNSPYNETGQPNPGYHSSPPS